MHPLLANITIFTWFNIISTEELAIQFAIEIGLIPSDSPPSCPKCSGPMKKNSLKGHKINWRWVCCKRSKTKNNPNPCTGTVSPVENTFLENSKIPVRDSLAIIFAFVFQIPLNFLYRHLCGWRKARNEPTLSKESLCDYFSYLREVCEIHSSHSYSKLGGKGKSILIDETFLTVRKYGRGRKTTNHSITVLGLFCREDKEGLLFRVDSKKKSDIWPYIARFCQCDTSVVYTDSAKQYHNVEKLFSSETTHEVTNHSKGEFVSKTDKANTINDLENENRWFKSSLKCRRSDKMLSQYMALHFYRRHFLDHLKTDAERIQVLVDHIIEVYPGPAKEGKKYMEFIRPTAQSENIEGALPKINSATNLNDEEVPFIDDVSDHNWDPSDV